MTFRKKRKQEQSVLRTHRTSIVLAVALGVLVVGSFPSISSFTAFFPKMSRPKTTSRDENVYHQHTYVFDGTPVVVIENFFPKRVADRWRNAYQRKWDANEFVLATNNDGKTNSFNSKFRSNERQSERRTIANRMLAKGLFSYVKHELPRGDPTLKEIETYMLSEATRERVGEALNTTGDRLNQTELSDLFATTFGPGDFLSAHDDGYAGTYAFVASLATGPTWRPEFGGALEFLCKSNRTWCGALGPKYRSLVLFRTRDPVSDGRIAPIHRVARVQDESARAGWIRHGFTGWYRDVRDFMSDHDLAEREKMRGK
eukprot:g4920.t1